ncbi:MAG: hypothetical protein HC850_14080 [Rhodomicrobium sp.]|nr:hypothetical protein [Rhodomicrobium sp.]
MRDAGGNAVPARVSVVASDGRSYGPGGAMMHADDGFDRALQRFETYYFHTDGSEEIMLPPGEATITVWRGLESAAELRKATITRDGARIDVNLSPLETRTSSPDGRAATLMHT